MLPVDDTLTNRLAALVPNPYPAGARQVYRGDGGPVRDESLPLLFGGFRASADVVVPQGGASGVLFALGDWNGGYALVALDGRLHFSFSRAGEAVEVDGTSRVPAGAHVLGVSYTNNGATGTFELFHDETPVGRVEFQGGFPLTFQHGGAALRIGADAGLPVTARYEVPFRWTGELRSLTFDVHGQPVVSVEEEVRAALHGD